MFARYQINILILTLTISYRTSNCPLCNTKFLARHTDPLHLNVSVDEIASGFGNNSTQENAPNSSDEAIVGEIANGSVNNTTQENVPNPFDEIIVGEIASGSGINSTQENAPNSSNGAIVGEIASGSGNNSTQENGSSDGHRRRNSTSNYQNVNSHDVPAPRRMRAKSGRYEYILNLKSKFDYNPVIIFLVNISCRSRINYDRNIRIARSEVVEEPSNDCRRSARTPKPVKRYHVSSAKCFVCKKSFHVGHGLELPVNSYDGFIACSFRCFRRMQ